MAFQKLISLTLISWDIIIILGLLTRVFLFPLVLKQILANFKLSFTLEEDFHVFGSPSLLAVRADFIPEHLLMPVAKGCNKYGSVTTSRTLQVSSFIRFLTFQNQYLSDHPLLQRSRARIKDFPASGVLFDGLVAASRSLLLKNARSPIQKHFLQLCTADWHPQCYVPMATDHHNWLSLL